MGCQISWSECSLSRRDASTEECTTKYTLMGCHKPALTVSTPLLLDTATPFAMNWFNPSTAHHV